MNEPRDPQFPDLLSFQNGQPVENAGDWRRRRAELLEAILRIEYGPLPPAPAATEGLELYRHTIKRLEETPHVIYRLSIGGPAGVQFILDLFLPPGQGPFPVVLNGDACWRHISDEMMMHVLHRGNILATFNRTEIVSDNGQADHAGGLSRLHPGCEFAALAAWAWGYHRCVDFLSTLPCVDAARIAIAGHSRGGKTTLLAAATDERIALAGVNGSGCGGAASYRVQGPQCESLANILQQFPYWFSPKLHQYIGRESSLPFDQHCVAALVAPRALLLTEALGDLWANPLGAWHTYANAKRVFEFLGAEEKIGIAYRDGGHEHNAQDWATLLDFIDLHFHGKSPARRFDANPFG